MGLIKAAAGAAGGVLADQWKEFFLCEALPANVLAVKGQKKTTRRSSNTHGDENIITSGSRIAVADGQCMLIVEQGKVVEVCAEPGEYTYDASTEPTIFAGNLGESIGQVFQNIGKRFTFGGEAPKDQRIYYFNTKELTGNKYGTPSPVPFRVVDQRAGIDIDIAIRCFGEYSYRITNPLLFYTNVCGNVTEDYTRDTIDGQLKSELLTALQPAFARISDMGIRYSSLPGHTREIAAALGYVDASHISKVFSARVGMRINDYRKTYRRVESICRIETDRRVYALVEYICRSYNEPLSARVVAEKFGCTAAEMNRALMLQVEKNFEEFLNYVRINRAAELLLTTDQTVTYIAMEVGYANVKTFNRNFLRFKVMTPGDFRKKVALQESRL